MQFLYKSITSRRNLRGKLDPFRYGALQRDERTAGCALALLELNESGVHLSIVRYADTRVAIDSTLAGINPVTSLSTRADDETVFSMYINRAG